MLQKTLLALGMLSMPMLSAYAQQVVRPSSPSIKAQGRVDTTNPERYRFDYPGVRFTMQFSGSSSIAAKLKGSAQTYFEAFVDGKPALDPSGRQAIYRSFGDTTIVIASKLAKNQPHEVILFKRTENLDNTPAEFMGFVVDDKASCSPAHYKARRIEFLGNSITCAFGTESKDIHSTFTAETENNYLSYANVLSRAFDADANIVAHSGRGVVRNYGDKSMVSTKEATVPKLFGRVLDSDSTSRWDFKRYQPDAVVVNLGTNDYSTWPQPLKSLFIDGYLKLIAKIRAAYGSQTQIFCIVGPMIDEPCYSYVKEMVEMQRNTNNDSHIHFIGIPKSILALDKDYGASGHPGGDGQKKMAQIVAPVISTVMGWSYSRTEMDDIKGGQGFYSREK
ncbi:GDSL-type esterase/lipase family protein [uncultured Acetobacteroides sp.]|uniref:SGNH/GDSL hydrolase family protein n=1 Tax=uncultured Acetobacteroides sp. TaxID=1760811 RepID=UPI0029F4EDCC|nr:GDSL-type esterase/lipase family protein [uncultured Acetobacteroides sp.]